MANYTIEISDIMNDPTFDLFNFEYDFYTDEVAIIENFEKKFIQHYYFNEIGCETVYRFKWNLKAKLDLIMPKYTQLYKTELATKDIDFMLNKDLREEFIRELDKEMNENGTSTDLKNIKHNSKTDNNNQTTQNRETESNNVNNNKSSNIENGNASVGLTDNYLTGVSQDSENGSGTEKLNSNDKLNEIKDIIGEENGRVTANKNADEKIIEKTIFTSQGNIGVQSAADLLRLWRGIIIDIDREIIEECSNLFLQVY